MLINKFLNRFFLIGLAFLALNLSQNIKCGNFESDKNGDNQGQKFIMMPDMFHSYTKTDDKTPLEAVFRSALKKGLENAVEGTTRKVVSNSLNWLPDSVSYVGYVLASTIYKIAFGSRGLTSRDLANINNRLYHLCSPFVSQSASGLDIKRRKKQIEQEQEDEPEIDQSWQDLQTALIMELNHGIGYLKKALPCYNMLYLNSPRNGLKYKLAKIVHIFSAEDCEQITFYSLQAISYIEMLVSIFERCKIIEDAFKKHDEIKRWLSLMGGSFEMISHFLESGKNAKRIAFSKVNASSSSNAQSIESLLGAFGEK